MIVVPSIRVYYSTVPKRNIQSDLQFLNELGFVVENPNSFFNLLVAESSPARFKNQLYKKLIVKCNFFVYKYEKDLNLSRNKFEFQYANQLGIEVIKLDKLGLDMTRNIPTNADTERKQIATLLKNQFVASNRNYREMSQKTGLAINSIKTVLAGNPAGIATYEIVADSLGTSLAALYSNIGSVTITEETTEVSTT